jgi:acetyl esterase
MSVAEARVASWNIIGSQGDPEAVASVDNRFIPGPTADLPIRIYYPEGRKPFPALIFLHGGGWTLLNIDIVDTTTRSLTNRTGCAIVSVNYQKAPEHRFPTPFNDVVAAILWVAENAADLNIDASRLGLMGESAGANLSAAAAISLRDRKGPRLRCQVLVYPPTDYDFDKPSYHDNADGYGLGRRDMHWFYDQYVAAESDAADPRVSPLRAKDLSNLPPALVITTEYDPLRDDGRLYAAKLSAHGTPVNHIDYAGLIHGALNMRGVVDASTTMHDDIGTWVRAILSA